MSGFQPVPVRHNVPADSRPFFFFFLSVPYVLVRHDGHRAPLAPAYDGPFRVLQRSRHSFKLQRGDKTDSLSVHWLKPAAVPSEVVPVQLPKRGRLMVASSSVSA